MIPSKTGPATVYGEMLSQEAWNSAYPPSEYSKKPPSDRTVKCRLHYLIALNQPIATIEKYITDNKDKAFAKLVEPDPDPRLHHVRPLHVAAMKGNLPVVNALLKVYQEKLKPQEFHSHLNSQDKQGWTPLHFAWLTSPDVREALIHAKAKATIANNMGATPKDLDLWVGRKVIQESMKTVILDLPGTPPVRFSDLGAAKLQELTGLHLYTDRRLYDQPAWKELWEETINYEGNDDLPLANDEFKKFFLQCRDRFPALKVTLSKALAGKVPLHFDVQAEAKIDNHTVLCVLSGLVKPKVQKCSSFAAQFSPPFSDDYYRFRNIDPTHTGGVWRWANSGWPNAIVMQAQGINGSTIEFLVATEAIAQGASIHWDYGPGVKALVWGKYLLLNREAMRKWFTQEIPSRKDEWDRAQKEISKNTSIAGWIKLNDKSGKLLYPLNNPAALLDLIFSGVTPVDDWRLFLNDMQHPIMKAWIETHRDVPAVVGCVIQRIMTFDDRLAGQKELKAKASEWIVENIGNLTVMQLLKAIEDIGEACKLKKLDLQSWEPFKTNLNAVLPNYDWLKDENASLGLKRRREDQLANFLLDPDAQTKLEVELKRMLIEGEEQNSEAIETVRWLMQQISQPGVHLLSQFLRATEKQPVSQSSSKKS